MEVRTTADRRPTRPVTLAHPRNPVTVGGGAPVSVQSMTTTKTADVDASTAIEPARQRWPAAPKAEPITPSTISRGSASGISVSAFLAPPSKRHGRWRNGMGQG